MSFYNCIKYQLYQKSDVEKRLRWKTISISVMIADSKYLTQNILTADYRQIVHDTTVGVMQMMVFRLDRHEAM